MRVLFATVAGSLFGMGLMVSGMTDTRKVLGWLDFFGSWDPSFAIVMGGAILPMAAAWIFAKRGAPVLGGSFPAANKAGPDRALVTGAILFGAGWGLVGLCPGSALASLTFGGWQGLVYLFAMIIGMVLAPPVQRLLTSEG